MSLLWICDLCKVSRTYATTFIWAAIIALVVYHTPIRPVNVAGMALLIAGMYCMGK